MLDSGQRAAPLTHGVAVSCCLALALMWQVCGTGFWAV